MTTMVSLWVIRILFATFFITITGLLIEQIVTRLVPRTIRSRRWIWVGAMVGSVALPLASVWMTWGHPLLSLILYRPITLEATTEVVMNNQAFQVSSLHPLYKMIGWLGHVGVNRAILSTCIALSVLGLLIFIAVHTWLYVQRKQWVSSQVEGTDVLITPGIGPAVIGVRNPVIVLPTWVLGAPYEMQRAILQHEGSHIAAGDSRTLAVSALILALMPWNLALWWQYRRLRAAIETDCDARVLANGVNVRQYGEMLLRVATRALPVPILSPAFCANPSLIERRIVAMTKFSPRCPRIQVMVYACAALVTSLAAMDTTSRDSSAFVTQMKMDFLGSLVLNTDALFNDGKLELTLPGKARMHMRMQIGGRQPKQLTQVPQIPAQSNAQYSARSASSHFTLTWADPK
jgi:beta-lactamase regulating signal transducer with metallopeptidase domain